MVRYSLIPGILFWSPLCCLGFTKGENKRITAPQNMIIYVVLDICERYFGPIGDQTTWPDTVWYEEIYSGVHSAVWASQKVKI